MCCGGNTEITHAKKMHLAFSPSIGFGAQTRVISLATQALYPPGHRSSLRIDTLSNRKHSSRHSVVCVCFGGFFFFLSSFLLVFMLVFLFLFCCCCLPLTQIKPIIHEACVFRIRASTPSLFLFTDSQGTQELVVFLPTQPEGDFRTSAQREAVGGGSLLSPD